MAIRNNHKRQKRRPASYPSADTLARERTGRGQGYRGLTKASIPASMQFFPDRYTCWCTAETNGSISAANTLTHTFIFNDPFNDLGPRVNFSGSFGANVPSGAYYLLAGLSDTAAQAPYASSIVLAYQCEVSIGSSSTSNTMPFIGGITFSPNLTATNTQPVTQLCEQPRTIYQNIPAYTTAKIIRYANSIEPASLVGLTSQQYRAQHNSYAASVIASPQVPLYAQCWFRAFDGSTTGTYSFTIRHRFQVQFFNLNSFTTSVPTLRDPRIANQDLKAPRSWYPL